MNIRTSAFRGLAILSLSVFGLAACEDKIELPTPEPDPIEVTVAPTQVEIPVGGTASAAAVVKNSTNQAVTWSSQATGVATVSATGVITGVAPGSTVIVATSAADANAKGFVSVTVVAPTITLTVLPTEATLEVAQTITLAATVSGSTNQAVTWATSAAGVATVSAAGVVTGVAPGTAVITATSAANTNVKNAAVVTVIPAGSTVQITLQPAEATTTIGGTVQLVADVTGTTNTAVTFESSATGVATVDANGLVTGVSGGTAVITATSVAAPTRKATSVITVSGAPPEPSISIASIVQNATGSPVNPDSIYGQVDVTVNVSAVPENDVRAVVLYVTGEGLEGDVEVCRQNFATPLGTTQGVATINCPVNTADYDDETFIPTFLNGEYTFEARALNGESPAEIIAEAQFCPGGDCIVQFKNLDTPNVTVEFDNDDDPTFAIGDQGLGWNSGDVIAIARPILYSGRTVAAMGVRLAVCNASILDEQELVLDEDDGFWKYTWVEEEDPIEDVTYQDLCVRVLDGLDTLGEEIDWPGLDPVTRSEIFNLDNEAPYVEDSNTDSNPRYYNDEFVFDVETHDNDGVDHEMVYLEIRSDETVLATGEAGEQEATLGTVGVAESATNAAYTLWAIIEDALGNMRSVQVGETFGIDFTDPTMEVTAVDEGGVADPEDLGTNLDLPLTFTFMYIDEATPPAGPSGFSIDPVTVNLRLYNAANPDGVCVDPTSTTFATGSVYCNTQLSTTAYIPDGDDGYYILTAFVTDAAENVSETYTFTTLKDYTPPFIGTLTVPSVLTGGMPFTMLANLTDNVDLGEGWATIGYSNGVTPGAYWLVQTEEVLGTYGLPLNTADVLGEITIAAVIRSVTQADATGRPVAANTYTAHVAEYAVLDVAGVELGSLCPVAAVPAVFDESDATQNCMLRRANIGPAYTIGNPTGVTTDWLVNNATMTDIILNNNAALGTVSQFVMDDLDPATPTPTDALDATITGPFQTFNNPFPNGVYFYGIDAEGRAHVLGTGSVSVTDNTITMTRTWRYSRPGGWPDDADTLYPGGVFALGVNGTTGDALATTPEPSIDPEP